MDRVRLMCWCRSCVGAMHLPAFASVEAGLFAERGIELEFVEAAKAPDWTYLATITATDVAKNRSGPKTISFKIVRR